MAEFKDMLKYYRSAAGLSQAELAKIIGVKPSTISMYEVGKRQPDFETEERIADFFNVSISILRGRDDERPADPFIVEFETAIRDVNDVGKARILAYAREIAQLYKKGEK